MAEPKPDQLAEDLYHRLRAVAEELNHLRDEAAELAGDLRKRLHTLTLQRKAVERLDGNREHRIAHQSGAANSGDQRQGHAA
jgi:hypothetical protein